METICSLCCPPRVASADKVKFNFGVQAWESYDVSFFVANNEDAFRVRFLINLWIAPFIFAEFGLRLFEMLESMRNSISKLRDGCT